MTRNHVPVHTDRDSMYWSLIAHSAATRCEQQAEEIAAMCEQLFQTFGGFLIPTEVEFHVHCFPSDQELPASVHDDSKIDTIHRTLQRREGIDVADVLEATRVDGDVFRWIPRIAIEGARVRVELDDGPVVADRTEHTVAYRGKRPTDDRPGRDPIELTLLHGPNSWAPAIQTEFVTSVLVRPWSDVWFQDTELGAANGRRLAAFLQRIETNLPVEVVERTSDWLPVDELEAVF